jgi:hypothetical protein
LSEARMPWSVLRSLRRSFWGEARTIDSEGEVSSP